MMTSVVDIESRGSNDDVPKATKYGRRSYALIALVVLALSGVIGAVVWWELRAVDVDLVDIDEDLMTTSAVLQGNFSINQVNGTYTFFMTNFVNGTRAFEFGLSDFAAPLCTSGVLSMLFSEEDVLSTSTDVSLAITTERTQRLVLPSEFTVQHSDVTILCDEADFGMGTTTVIVPPDMLNPIVKSGTFSGPGSYTSTGKMSIVRSSSIVNGNVVVSYALRFEDILISSGPDVFLYLTRDASPTDVDSRSLRLKLDGIDGGFFAKTGNFVQALPANFDPDLYDGATSWCRRFGVLFGTLAFT